MRRFIFSVLIFSCALSPLFAIITIPFEGGTQEEIIAAIDQVAKEKPSKKNDLTPTLSALAKAILNPKMSVKVRESSAWALGQLNDKNHIPVLMTAAKDKGLLVRSAALNSLIQMRAHAALPILIQIASSDPVMSLRQRATLGLGLLQTDKAIQPLVKLSSDEREEIRGASALAMAATHTKKNNFSEALKEMQTQDQSHYVQERSKVGLAIVSRKNDSVKPYLHSNEADIRLFAAVYFREFGTAPDLKTLQETLEGESNDDVQQQLTVSMTTIKARVAHAAAVAKKKKLAAQAQRKHPAPQAPQQNP